MAQTSIHEFGKLSDGTVVKAYRLENEKTASLTIIDFGATIQSLCVPDREGVLRDVVLGYDSAEEYEKSGGYFGATIGRVANRIGGGLFSLNGVEYQLPINDGDNHLHGGIRGFHKHMWNARFEDDKIVCERLSADGEEGYPGNLNVRVTFSLTDDNKLDIIYDAIADADTLVNMTNHSYFNLDGSDDILDHKMQVFADKYCETDENCLPTGRLLYVDGTAFDFRKCKKIGRDIDANDEQLKGAGGYDHNYCLSGHLAAIVSSEKSGIRMVAYTDMPGMQVYTGNHISKRQGKKGNAIDFRSGFCLETQLYPNAMACYGFPSPVLKAGQSMHSETSYCFDLTE